MAVSSLLIRSPLSPDELIEHIDGYVQVVQSFSPDPLPEDTATRLLSRLIKRGLVLEYLTLGWNVVGALRKDS